MTSQASHDPACLVPIISVSFNFTRIAMPKEDGGVYRDGQCTSENASHYVREQAPCRHNIDDNHQAIYPKTKFKTIHCDILQ